jgi:hypothetical protein
MLVEVSMLLVHKAVLNTLREHQESSQGNLNLSQSDPNK